MPHAETSPRYFSYGHRVYTYKKSSILPIVFLIMCFYFSPINLIRNPKWKANATSKFLSQRVLCQRIGSSSKESILSIPVFATNIKLVQDNKMLQKMRFQYEEPEHDLRYFIDVSVLPLNDEYTRISLHATHIDGQAFHKDSDMAIALHDFESAVAAALNGDTSLYQPTTRKTKHSKGFVRYAFGIMASVGILMLKKKLSW